MLTFNNHLDLYGQVQNLKWILCGQKTGIKCGLVLKILVYKRCFCLDVAGLVAYSFGEEEVDRFIQVRKIPEINKKNQNYSYVKKRVKFNPQNTF